MVVETSLPLWTSIPYTVGIGNTGGMGDPNVHRGTREDQPGMLGNPDAPLLPYG